MYLPTPADAFRLANEVLDRMERRLDARFGRPMREAAFRYIGITLVALPAAWAIDGFRFEATPFYGVAAGLVLYAVIDRTRVKPPAKDAPRDAPP